MWSKANESRTHGGEIITGRPCSAMLQSVVCEQDKRDHVEWQRVRLGRRVWPQDVVKDSTVQRGRREGVVQVDRSAQEPRNDMSYISKRSFKDV